MTSKGDMLEAIKVAGTIGRTHLMYRTNLDWTTLDRHLPDLIRDGLVAEKERSRRDDTWQRESRWTGHRTKPHKLYSLTALGAETLAHYLAVKKALGEKALNPQDVVVLS